MRPVHCSMISRPTIAASMRLFLRVIAETLRCT
nr:MAG TPA: hypothetical protein [Caudoviricetes sp.]DAI93541.1 MAG TPA: hypothetical protein [Bacteriophage sp.]